MHDRGAGFVTYFFFGVGIVICDVALLVLPLGEHVPFQLLQVGQKVIDSILVLSGREWQRVGTP